MPKFLVRSNEIYPSTKDDGTCTVIYSSPIGLNRNPFFILSFSGLPLLVLLFPTFLKDIVNQFKVDSNFNEN